MASHLHPEPLLMFRKKARRLWLLPLLALGTVLVASTAQGKAAKPTAPLPQERMLDLGLDSSWSDVEDGKTVLLAGAPFHVFLNFQGFEEQANVCLSFVRDEGTRQARLYWAGPSGREVRLAGPDTSGWPEGDYRVEARPCAVGPLGYPMELSGQHLSSESFALLRGSRGPASASAEAPARFPWPPPRPYSHCEISPPYEDRSDVRLGEVAAWLKSALDERGYYDRRFYQVEEGFAVVTRMEQIDQAGHPLDEPERWSTAFPSRPLKNFSDWLAILFTAPEGHYRIVVFIVTSEPFTSRQEELSPEEAGDWLHGGFTGLPPSVGTKPWTADHRITALIYQFKRSAAGEGGIAVLEPAPARKHLETSGLWEVLQP